MGDVTIPKSTEEDHIKENFDATKINLEPEEVERIKRLDRNLRRNTYDWLFLPRIDSVENAWDVTSDSAYILPGTTV